VGSLGMMMTLLDNDEMSREDFKSVSHDIKEQVDTVHATLENLLVWSRAQMKGIQTVKKILDIADLTNRQMGLLQQAATAKKIALVNEVPSGSLAMADADQVDFIVRNLVANAIKFTQNNGQVKVSATEANGWFTIAVKDNGCGIDEKILPTLFSMDNVSSFSSNSESRKQWGQNMGRKQAGRRYRFLFYTSHCLVPRIVIPKLGLLRPTASAKRQRFINLFTAKLWYLYTKTYTILYGCKESTFYYR
jgi:K+-sensing histidine kinase KdpD